MENKTRTVRATVAAFLAVLIFLIFAKFVTTPESVQQSPWSLVPPIIAIVLALVTKEVYSSLFIGILTGALFYSGFSFEGTMNHIFGEGIIAQLSDAGNVGILIFLVILGAIVQLMNRTGGSAAFGDWAARKITSRKGAQLATIGLGVLIFIDDYFNCLTVGSVMRPVTDEHKISRAKLAYLIDATAAPVCIIAPISSWAAAVAGFVEGENGLALFIRTIPYNYYAILTICMMIMMVVMNINYGPMASHEYNAVVNGDLYTTPDRPYENAKEEEGKRKGKVVDMLVPIFSLIIGCVVGMIYTGGFFSGTGFVDAFANSDATVGLALGSFGGLVVTIAFYLIRNALPFEEIMNCLPEGFKQMVPAILILTFAWTLNDTTKSLGAKEFVAAIVESNAKGMMFFLPFVIFLIAVFLSFATGTSWGTFGILIPIVVAIFQNTDPKMMIIAMSACMAGSVCGDHCSPISDTTIMSSAGAQCNHINHVSTQMPYAFTCAGVSAVTYIIAGAMEGLFHISNPILPLACGFVLLLILMLLLRNSFGGDFAKKPAGADKA